MYMRGKPLYRKQRVEMRECEVERMSRGESGRTSSAFPKLQKSPKCFGMKNVKTRK
jgi:hypothetical protein